MLIFKLTEAELVVCKKVSQYHNHKHFTQVCQGHTMFLKGPKGDKGSSRTVMGYKGSKGEPGPINDSLILELKCKCFQLFF